MFKILTTNCNHTVRRNADIIIIFFFTGNTCLKQLEIVDCEIFPPYTTRSGRF